MTRLSRAQADRLKEIVNKDANLVAAYLEVKGLGSTDKWEWDVEYEKKNPNPDRYGLLEDWYEKRDSAWAEYVNEKLLPENVTGACVVGGIFLAAFSAHPEHKEEFINLFMKNAQSIASPYFEGVNNLLKDEFGLTPNMLKQIQLINDSIKYDTELRRKSICARLDSFVRYGDQKDSWEYDRIEFPALN